ncbi:hypothetical protein [Methylobacterium aquaticum]|uniref:hypothetical protein n=1 Tax=Methylobacterium aquaticum TaxID=270351 RepID=UPI001932379B|nr:hypothetical protein [Methylobacterium aquaticum]QRE77078.1 hypothetical protein F1D61_29195 [Methylobacterium aquaticum]
MWGRLDIGSGPTGRIDLSEAAIEKTGGAAIATGLRATIGMIQRHQAPPTMSRYQIQGGGSVEIVNALKDVDSELIAIKYLYGIILSDNAI